jgi:hypothetical protein
MSNCGTARNALKRLTHSGRQPPRPQGLNEPATEFIGLQRHGGDGCQRHQDAADGRSGARQDTLYSDALSDANGPAATYLDMFRHNIDTLTAALSS